MILSTFGKVCNFVLCCLSEIKWINRSKNRNKHLVIKSDIEFS